MVILLIFLDKQSQITLTFNSRPLSKPFMISQFSKMEIQFGIADYENCNFMRLFPHSSALALAVVKQRATIKKLHYPTLFEPHFIIRKRHPKQLYR